MKFFPNRTTFLAIGNYTIQWYAVLIMSGALIVYYLSGRKLAKKGYNADVMDDLFAGALFFGVIGARAWYVLFYDLKEYLADPISIIQIWNGGLAIHGALTGGALFIVFYCKKHNYDFLHIGDIIFPYILIAQAIGRWGNFANQEAFGQIVEESYFDGILSFLKNGMYIDYHYREPMFFYESVANTIGFILITLYERYSTKKVRGQGLFCYLSWYGLVRFFIEIRRSDALMLGSIKVAQLSSVLFMIVGIAGLLGVFNKKYLKEKPLVIFDLDGTLLDTEEIIFKSFEHVFRKHAPELVLTEQDRVSFLGPTLKESFEKYCPQGDIDQMIAEFREYNQSHHGEYVKAFDGVEETLQYLKDNGYQMAIASSKIKDTIKIGLQCTGLDKYFNADNILGVEEVVKNKPDRETVSKACQKMKRQFTSALYVGDSVTDIQCGHNAGVFSVAVVTNRLKDEELNNCGADRVIYNMRELQDILKEEHLWTKDMM